MPGRQSASERTCIVTREVRPADELIRFVLGPDGAAVPDLKRRLPGRGVWVTATREHVATAIRTRKLERQLKAPAAIADDLAEMIDGLLMSAAQGALSLARRAGEVVSGFVKVEAALGRGDVAALIHAPDAGRDGRAKIAAAARRTQNRQPRELRCFEREHLDLAFGRTNVIHAALLAGRASENVLQRVDELMRYRGEDASEAGIRDENAEGRMT